MSVQTDPTQLESWELLLLRASHEMSLSQPQYELIERRYETLQDALAAATSPLLQDAHIFVQGSIGLRTTIKPASDAKDDMATIDADAIVWLPHAGEATGQEVLQALEARLQAAARVEEPIFPLRRGARIIYADENPGFHIDVTPARSAAGNGGAQGEGALQVADRYSSWKPSSPRPYSEWLAATADMRIVMKGMQGLAEHSVLMKEASQDPIPDYQDYIDGNPLRAAIKLLKRHRDVWAIANKQESVRPISAIITTLTARAYRELATSGRIHDMRPIQAIFEIVDKMPRFINSGRNGYEVCNPEDPGENFAEKWNRPAEEGQAYRQAFVQWHADAVADMRLGLEDFGSEVAFREALIKRFSVTDSLIREVLRDVPNNWTMPGRAPGTSRNAISLAALSGSHAAGSGSQGDVKPTGRLG